MKKNIFFPMVALLLAGALLPGCVSRATFETKAREADALTSRNESLQAQVKSLDAETARLKADTASLQAENAALKKDRETGQSEKEALQARINELTRKAEKAEQLEKTTQTYQDLQKKLEKEIQEGQVQITEMKNRLTMTMVDKIIFPSGSAKISPEGKKVLDKVVSILKDVKDKRIEVEGHTDNVPIVSALKKRFPTNWELSTARATEVVRYLQESGGLDPKLLSATGFAEYQPVAPNDSEEGKHKNRRIEIVLLPPLK